MKRSHASAVLLAALLVVPMVACSPSSTPSAGQNDATQSQAPAASGAASAGGGKEVILWGDWSGEGAQQIESMVKEYNAAQTDYTATYVVQQDIITKFLTASTSGSAPDAIVWDRWRTALYAPKNVLAPIDDLMARDGIDAADFYAEPLKELSLGGKTYGLPLTIDARALFYNKAMFAEKGLQPPTTWEELATCAKALTVWNGDKLEVAGFSLSDVGLFSMWIGQAGGRMVSEDGSKTAFNSPEGLEVLNFWDRLVNEDKVYKIGFETGMGENIDAFATGKVAMMYNGPWMLTTYEKYGKDLEFGVVPPPAGPRGDKYAVVGGWGLALPAKGKNAEGGWDLISWWMGDAENAAKWGKLSLNIPGNAKATDDAYWSGNEIYKAFLDTFEFGRIRPQFAGYADMEGQASIPELQLFLGGSQGAEETLKKAQEAGDKVLAQINQ